MMRVKKILSIVLLLVMIVSVLPQVAWAYTVTTPSQSGVTSSKYFTALPGVYEMGDGYAVIWATSFKGTGYITYKYNGTTYTVYDMKNGIVRTGDNIHVVKVPHEHLLGNSYTVYSREVTSHSYALTNYGTTISAGPITLRKYDSGTFDALVVTDTHGEVDWTVDIVKKFSEDPDLVIFSGDIANHLATKNDIVNMFNLMGKSTGGRYPIIYCRGNHEIRDVYASVLLEYFPTETGEFYFDFRYGPMWGVVMDTGEDKDDNHEYYGNLANYTEYYAKQEAWLRSLRMDSTATYRLAINHIPNIHTLPNSVDYSDSVGHLGFQIAVSGHKHWTQLYGTPRADYTAKLGYETVCCGGYAANSAVWMKFNGSYTYLTTQRGNGSNTTVSGTNVNTNLPYVNFNNYKIPLSTNRTSVPSSSSYTQGVQNHFNPTTASKGTVTLATQPAVFESGGDWYNVVWKTNKPSSAEGVTGYVEYTYNGTNYQVFEEVGGYRRVCDDFHTVKVPKAHLNNNVYRVGSFLMEYAFTSSGGRYYTAGDWVESQDYLFENKTEDSTVSLIACPDLEMNGTSARFSNARNAVAALGTAPAYIILNGNIVEQAMYGGDQLTYLLQGAGAISGSIHPIILSRGFTECRGYTAPNLMKYFPTATGEFYYTVKVGDYTLVNLDTAEDQKDSATAVSGGSTVSKYGGRVSFDSYRQTQLSWINSLFSGKLIAISSTPLDEVKSVFGLDYEKALKNKGAVLSISGHSGSYSLDTTVNSSNMVSVTPGGLSTSSGTDAAAIVVSGDYAYIEDIRSNSGSNSTLASTAVNLTNGSTVSQGSSQPPLSNGVYQVSTPAHLRWISDNCTSTTSFAGKTFQQINDIDLQMYPFNPIGGNDSVSDDGNSTSYAFSGTFDGAGYTIKNVNINSAKNNVGFFGLIRGGTVKNLHLSGGIVTGGWYVGGLVGGTFKASTIQDCSSDLLVCSTGGTKVGGVTGFLTGGSSIIRCANHGTVVAGHASGSAGGIVGQIVGSTTNYITSSFNRGMILGRGSGSNAGGIFGYAGNVSAAIANCYNAAVVNALGSEGAIMSSYGSSGKITVSNTYFAQGYAGAAYATKSSNKWTTSSGSGTISSKTQSSMKSSSFANTLGSSAFVYKSSVNDGYPVHAPCGDGHIYTQSEQAPTCSVAGKITYTCSRCGDSYSTTIAATGHSYSSVVTAPTCTAKGYTTHTCSTCGNVTKETLAATGHSYTYKVTTKPTSKKTGILTGTCSECEDTATITLPLLTTTNYKKTKTKAATCTAKGTWTWTWKDTTYGTVKITTSISATGHSYSYEVTKNPTVSATGVLTGSCTACDTAVTVELPQLSETDYSYEESAATCDTDGVGIYTWNNTTYGTYSFEVTFAATGHSYTYKVTTKPTSKKTGVLTGTCSECDGTATITLPLLTTTNYKKTKTKAATCTAKGTWTWTWKDTTYGTVKVTTSISATGHSYSYEVTKNPTVSATGVLTGSCTACDTAVTVELPQLSETDYSYEESAATCDTDGVGIYTWNNTTYGTYSFEVTLAATGHSYTYKVTTKPTSKKTGVLTGTCSECEDAATITLPLLTTTNYKKTKTKAATCTAKGTWTWKWKDTTYGTIKVTSSISATGHSYTYKVTTKPTSKKTGVLTGTCSECDDTTEITLPLLNTTNYTRTKTKVPTCTAKGTWTWTWKDTTYGTIKVTSSISATSHSYTYKVTTKPSSKKTGILTGTCSECDDTTEITLPLLNTTNYTRTKTKVPTCTAKGTWTWTWKDTTYGTIKVTSSISATSHSYTYKVTTKPSSKKTGILTGTCSECDGATEITLPLLNTTNYTRTKTKVPTCTAKGTWTWTWKDTTYGDVKLTSSISATGHSYSYAVTKNPTTGAVGTLTGTCTVCGSTVTVTLPKLSKTDYSYEVKVAATSNKTGVGVYIWNNTDYGTYSFEVTIAKTGKK